MHGARGRLAWMLKRRIAMSGLRALARTLLDRLEHVGEGAQGRNARRAARRARRSAFYTAEDARHEHGRCQESNHYRMAPTMVGCHVVCVLVVVAPS